MYSRAIFAMPTKAFRNLFLLAIGAVFVSADFNETITFTAFPKYVLFVKQFRLNSKVHVVLLISLWDYKL